MPNMDWYHGLLKPDLTPPDFLFGVVWPVLYFLMGLSLVLLWKNSGKKLSWPLFWFALQLVLNLAWSPVFFGMRNIGGGLAVILLLFFALSITVALFYRRYKISGWLLIPYWFWVLFAVYLNFGIWLLNS